jgi:hypothetical protein
MDFLLEEANEFWNPGDGRKVQGRCWTVGRIFGDSEKGKLSLFSGFNRNMSTHKKGRKKEDSSCMSYPSSREFRGMDLDVFL